MGINTSFYISIRRTSISCSLPTRTSKEILSSSRYALARSHSRMPWIFAPPILILMQHRFLLWVITSGWKDAMSTI